MIRSKDTSYCISNDYRQFINCSKVNIKYRTISSLPIEIKYNEQFKNNVIVIFQCMYIIIYFLFLDSEQIEEFISITMMCLYFHFCTQKCYKKEYYNHEMFHHFPINIASISILK